MDTTKYSPAAGLPSEEHNTVQASWLSFAEEQMVRHSTWIPRDRYMDILLGKMSTARHKLQTSYWSSYFIKTGYASQDY
jgi:hypothetical protein